ncbi:MAG TPA: NAD(P)/FAD-dependent oxidoreductase [Burkholderiales bacterium]|nr:NAD(P)/FAD-dependent oxidoreductase [Burkholderiales bacterium]
MQAGSDALATVANHWLARFETALAQRDGAALRALFHPDSHWRDVLALTWRIQTTSGAEAIAARIAGFTAGGFRTDPERTPPRHVTRAGEKCIEAIFRFETPQGVCNGVVRLKGEEPKAWTFLTALHDLKGHEEHVGKLRPRGEAYSRDFAGPNWLDIRKKKILYEDREPSVLVVGGGQAGLSIAARLGQRDIDTLVVDRWPRVGDNWRRRYHALTLHNQVHVNHLPYMPFPPNWPVYIPKDKLANWFEAYAEAMELNYWTSTEFLGGEYDQSAGRWEVKVSTSGKTRVLHPRHVVMATGVSGIKNIPDIPALRGFKGTVLHSGEYTDATPWKGKKAIVIGTGTSGHDVAQDLHSAGAQVTIVQRSPTLVINCDPSAQLVYGLYSEGPPLEDCDLITVSVPLQVSRRTHQLATAHAKELDRDILEKLERRGFRLSDGDDGTGWQFLYLTRGGGYYFNVGCSELIAEGKVRLAQYSQLEGLVGEADLVVLATGYKGLEGLVEKLFGKAVAERVGPIWGFGEGQELRNMFQRTAQPGLWFIAGSFAQCRIYSRYLALQIQAQELGLI